MGGAVQFNEVMWFSLFIVKPSLGVLVVRVTYLICLRLSAANKPSASIQGARLFWDFIPRSQTQEGFTNLIHFTTRLITIELCSTA